MLFSFGEVSLDVENYGYRNVYERAGLVTGRQNNVTIA